MEYLLLLLLFIFIYNLNNQVQTLRKEVYFLKKSLSKNQNVESQPEELITTNKLNSIKKHPIKKSPIKKSSNKNNTPNPIDKLFEHIKTYFTQGNIVVRIGGVILFFGLAFLAKYATEHSTIGIEVRLAGIALSSVVFVGIGWWLRKRENYYGLILQGLGVAIAYLLVFVSAKLYTILPLSASFIIMLIIVIFGSLLAIVQNALPLALFAITGGFVAPILTSDGNGSHIMLFSYFALLNSGIVAIAWYRSWRVLNLTGFIFTFIIATAWGVLKYDSALLMSIEPFLILFFLFYLTVSILFTLKQSFKPREVVDATLVFGLPLVAFSLQSSLVGHIQYAIAFSAIVMGSLYFILFKILSHYEKMRLLSQAFLALGVIFYTISIPNFFDNQITGALWALEASAVLWISLKQNNFYARVFAQVLLVIATVLYLITSLSHHEHTQIIFLNTIYLGYAIVYLANFIASYLLYSHKSQLSSFDKDNAPIFLGIGLGLWLFSGLTEVDAGIYGVSCLGIFMILSATIIHTYKLIPNIEYKEALLKGIIILLSFWELYAIMLDANPSPLPYIPLLNPLELTQLFGFILIYKWIKIKNNTFEKQYPNVIYKIGGTVVLVFVTIILARSIHFYIDVAYQAPALLHNIVFQMSLSLLWSIIAISVILLAKHKENRSIWIAGASLMGVVIVKLFLVELASSGSVERIVSFIVVGLLLLLIGYFAPLPPVKKL